MSPDLLKPHRFPLLTNCKFFQFLLSLKFLKYTVKETKEACSNPSGVILIHCIGSLKIKLPPGSRIFVTALK